MLIIEIGLGIALGYVIIQFFEELLIIGGCLLAVFAVLFVIALALGAYYVAAVLLYDWLGRFSDFSTPDQNWCLRVAVSFGIPFLYCALLVLRMFFWLRQ
jgi:hypothetical protein